MAEYIPDQYADTATWEGDVPATPPMSLSRRALLGAGAVAGGIGAFGHVLGTIERPIMDAAFANTATQIEFGTDCDLSKPLAHASIASPGWDGAGGKSIVDRLIEQKVYGPTFPSAYFKFDGLVTPESVTECCQAFCQRVEIDELDVHAISEGGMISLIGALAMERPIRLITSNASPFDIYDTKRAFVAKVIAKANEYGLYRGGLIGKYFAMLGREADEYGWAAFSEYKGEAWDKVFDGVDPRVLVSQTTFLDQANLWDKRDEFKRKGIINSDTNAIFMMAEQPNTDDVVWLESAMNKWKDFYEYFGAQWSVIEVPVPGHAHMNAGFEAATAKMQQILNEYQAA